MNIDEFTAQHADAEEIESTRRWARWVSGEYDSWGHATGEGAFCNACGEEWESADYCCSSHGCEFGLALEDDDEDEGEDEGEDEEAAE